MGQSSNLTVLNAEHVWVSIFEVQALGVSKDRSTGSKLEGKQLKPVNFDVEHCFLFFCSLRVLYEKARRDDVGTILIFLIEIGKLLKEISAYTIKYALLLCKQRSWNANG